MSLTFRAEDWTFLAGESTSQMCGLLSLAHLLTIYSQGLERVRDSCQMYLDRFLDPFESKTWSLHRVVVDCQKGRLFQPFAMTTANFKDQTSPSCSENFFINI